jgi:hypothetical protein
MNRGDLNRGAEEREQVKSDWLRLVPVAPKLTDGTKSRDLPKNHDTVLV